MSCFLDSISTIITIFHKHAKEDGDCSNFNRRKMKEFIQREFADVIAKPHDYQTIDKILQFLEWDGDGEIDFNEFLLLVFRVAKACYWYLPKGPYILQRTKLTTSGKALREPEIKNRESQWQLQEEEQQNCESNRDPRCEPELQQDTRVNELESLEDRGSHHQQRNAQSRNDANKSREPGVPIPQVSEERSQEPCDQQKKQRRDQQLEPERRRDVQLYKHSNFQGHEPGVQAGERQNQEGPQPGQLANVRSRSQTCKPQPLPNRWSSHQPHETALPTFDQKNQQPQEADRQSQKKPSKPDLLTKERSRYHLHDLKQNALENSSDKKGKPECRNSRELHQSYIEEPQEIDLRYYEKCEIETGNYEKWNNLEDETKYPENEREKNQYHQLKETDDERQKQYMQERRTDSQRELELEVYERRSRQTRDREERGATADRRGTGERRDGQTREPEDDGRGQREPARYERTRETAEVAAEADVKIHRVSRELEPRQDGERRDRPREREEPEDERRLCREREREEPVRERRTDRQRELELEVYERRSRQTRDMSRTDESEVQRNEAHLYQTVEVDNRDLFAPGEQASVTDMRVRYIPAEPDVQPEVQVLPHSCEPQTVAYLIHVIQNLDEPEAATYKITCQQPHNLGQPIYVKKCFISPQPPAVPCDRSSHPEAQPLRDEQETGEPTPPRQVGTPASSSLDLEPQERYERGVKEGVHQASVSEPDGVKGDPCQAKTKEDSQHPKVPDVVEKEHQPQGDGSKAAREQVPQEPKSICQVREHGDSEAKSCSLLPQALEPQEACETGQRAAEESRPQPPQRDEASRCHEDAELPPPEKSLQPQQEENSKRSSQQVSDARPQREEEPHLCTKQSQGPPGPLVSEEAPSRPAGDKAKAS